MTIYAISLDLLVLVTVDLFDDHFPILILLIPFYDGLLLLLKALVQPLLGHHLLLTTLMLHGVDLLP